MSQDELAIHYVCTLQQAREIALRRSHFWVSNCGCREARGHCQRSRMDVCLFFCGDAVASGTGLKEISLIDAMSILEEAHEKRLVSRPFRNDEDRSVTDGICFCCDDCCGYFLNPAENRCDKGSLIESTDLEKCNFCGDCVGVCYFNARSMKDNELIVERGNCHGCGLCMDICPEKCVEMIART